MKLVFMQPEKSQRNIDGGYRASYNKVIAGEEKVIVQVFQRRIRKLLPIMKQSYTCSKAINKSIPKVTIIPTPKELGYTIKPQERMYETKQEMLNEIKISLGGRAVEEIVFGEENVTSGMDRT